MEAIDRIESYILQLDLPYEELGEGIWVVKDQGETIHNVVTLTGPVVLMRIKIVDIPEHRRESLFRLLLELNATEMLHGAYGLEGNEVVMVEVLSLERVDFPTFQQAIEAMFMAVTSHHGMVSRLLAVTDSVSQEAR